MFDVVVESCRVDYRKSDPESYQLTFRRNINYLLIFLDCRQNGRFQTERECILVDDSELNVKGAIREKMYGIQVSFSKYNYLYFLPLSILKLQQKGEDSATAVKKLEELVGFSLRY